MDTTQEALKILKRIEDEKGWVKKRYSPDAILNKLKLWETNLIDFGKKHGLDIAESEVYKYFYMSYFRTLSSKKFHVKQETQLMNCIINIKKDRLLNKVKSNGESSLWNNNRWKEFKLERLEKRFSIWENEVRKAASDISDTDVFRFFRKRYLQVTEKQFIKQEIPVGIKNTKEFIKKREKLKLFFINNNHPHFEHYINMPPWEFNRKFNTLKNALNLFNNGKINFPLTKNSTNKREFNSHLKKYPVKDRPNEQEEMLFKLILNFNGMSLQQIEHIYTGNRLDIRNALDKLIHLEFIEEEEHEDDLFFKKISDETQKELILDKWLDDLRTKITIGTGEALNYFEKNYQEYGVKKLRDTVIPQITKKILEDRKKYLEEMGIDESDPRYEFLFRRKKAELKKELENFELIMNDFKENKTEIPKEYEIEITSYSENGTKEKDTKVFWLIYKLKEASYQQLSNIYKKFNNGKIGFKLKTSLTRLSSSRLIKVSKGGLLQIIEY